MPGVRAHRLPESCLPGTLSGGAAVGERAPKPCQFAPVHKVEQVREAHEGEVFPHAAGESQTSGIRPLRQLRLRCARISAPSRLGVSSSKAVRSTTIVRFPAIARSRTRSSNSRAISTSIIPRSVTRCVRPPERQAGASCVRELFVGDPQIARHHRSPPGSWSLLQAGHSSRPEHRCKPRGPLRSPPAYVCSRLRGSGRGAFGALHAARDSLRSGSRSLRSAFPSSAISRRRSWAERKKPESSRIVSTLSVADVLLVRLRAG